MCTDKELLKMKNKKIQVLLSAIVFLFCLEVFLPLRRNAK